MERLKYRGMVLHLFYILHILGVDKFSATSITRVITAVRADMAQYMDMSTGCTGSSPYR